MAAELCLANAARAREEVAVYLTALTEQPTRGVLRVPTNHRLWRDSEAFLKHFVRRVHRSPISIAFDDYECVFMFPSEYSSDEDSDEEYCRATTSYATEAGRRASLVTLFTENFCADLLSEGRRVLEQWLKQCRRALETSQRHFGILASSVFGDNVAAVEAFLSEALGVQRVDIGVHWVVRSDIEDDTCCNAKLTL